VNVTSVLLIKFCICDVTDHTTELVSYNQFKLCYLAKLKN
jgi:hypothetical protein